MSESECEEVQAVVIDVGTGMTKAGFAGDDGLFNICIFIMINIYNETNV